MTLSAAAGAGLRLRDGRRLGYAEYGDPRGTPVLYFHGFASSRLEAALAAASAQRLGVRLIAVDRPGYGLSEFQPGRALGDWPRDVVVLADALGLGRFAVLGVSGGGPYALACAWKIPLRLTAAGLVGAFGPGAWGTAQPLELPMWLRLGLAVSFRWPPFLRLFFAALAWGMQRVPRLLLRRLTAELAAADLAVLADPALRAGLIAAMQEGLRAGAAGAVHELRLYARPWGFEPRQVTMEVQLWHGECDAVVPPALGRQLAAQLPRCRTHFYPQEGHYSLPVRHMEEILGSLRRPP